MTGHGKTSIETDVSYPVPGAMGTTTPWINWAPIVYDELCRLARAILQATAPVNEADLRLVRLQRDAIRPHNAVFVV